MAGFAKALVRGVRELGFDPRGPSRVAFIARYVRDLRAWRRLGGRIDAHYPVLRDWGDQAGTASGAYFHQDLLVAKLIHAANPRRHLDVGSRVDGFVAHVAVFREIEVLDIRPNDARVGNIRFVQADLMQDSPALAESTDSLSCLHALEHFGLGRYGDGIDPGGHLRGFRSLVRMVEPGGTLYLSFPVGRPAVEFNAHRVFGCLDVLSWPESTQLELRRFDFVDDAGNLHEDVALDAISGACEGLVMGCGIYTFVKRR